MKTISIGDANTVVPPGGSARAVKTDLPEPIENVLERTALSHTRREFLKKSGLLVVGIGVGSTASSFFAGTSQRRRDRPPPAPDRIPIPITNSSTHGS